MSICCRCMKVKTLPPVEALTPLEIADRAQVPQEWLSRMLESGRIPHTRAAGCWLPLISSDKLERVSQMYREWQTAKERQRAANKEHYSKQKRRHGRRKI